MTNKLNIVLVSLFFLIAVPVFSSVSAASFAIDPSTVTTTAGQQFTVSLTIDAGTNQILATDAYITYPPALLEFVSAEDGTYENLALGTKDSTSSTDELYLAHIVEAAGRFGQASGTLAEVTFKAKANGTATLAFRCTPGSTTDSNIANNVFNAPDIITCTDNKSATITIGTGVGGPTATPAATLVPTTGVSTSTITPTQLPQTGMADTLVPFILPGLFLVIMGMGMKILL